MTGRATVAFVRIWLPALVVAGGVLVIVVGGDEVALEGGAGIIGAGLAIWLFGFLMRMGTSNESDRTREEDARAHYDRHGVWPDDDPAAQPRGDGLRPGER